MCGPGKHNCQPFCGPEGRFYCSDSVCSLWPAPFSYLCVSVMILFIVQELCESRGGRPGLSVLTSLLVSVDVKIYCTVLRHWSQLVPNMSHDI